MTQEIKVYNLNVRGIGDLAKRHKIFNYLKNTDADIFCIQESHSSTNMEELWVKQWAGQAFFSHGETNARGVCTLIHPRLTCEAKIHYRDDEDNTVQCNQKGRCLILEISVKGLDLTICNIYAPNKDVSEFFQVNMGNMKTADHVERIVVGDFNCVMDVKLDRLGSLNNHHQSAKMLHNLVETLDLCDIFRLLNPQSKRYTWLKTNPYKHFARLDFYLISNSLCNRIADVEHLPGFCTDHSAVTLTIRSSIPKRGRGFWKFNVNHLRDTLFIDWC